MEEIKGNANGETGEVANPAESGQAPASLVNVEESGTSKEAAKQTEEAKGPEPTAAEKRIRQLVAMSHDKDREIQRLREQLETKPEPQKPAEPPGLKSPVAADFENYDDYLVAKAAYKIKVDQAAEAEARARQQLQETMREIDDKFSASIEEDSVSNPEIKAIRDRVGVKITPAVGLAIKQSEVAPDVLRYLDAQPNEIERLCKLNPIAAAKEIGKIEAKLSSKGAAKVKTGAPDPVTPPAKSREGSIVTQKGDDEISIDEYMERFRTRGK